MGVFLLSLDFLFCFVEGWEGHATASTVLKPHKVVSFYTVWLYPLKRWSDGRKTSRNLWRQQKREKPPISFQSRPSAPSDTAQASRKQVSIGLMWKETVLGQLTLDFLTRLA